MIDSPPPPPRRAQEGGPAAKARVKKPWSKPVIHRVNEMPNTGTGSKAPTLATIYENAPSGGYPQYMPNSATQTLHPS